jgi:threonine dehydratase
MQVPAGQQRQFARFLAQLNYRYRDESENPAYHLFLGSHSEQ